MILALYGIHISNYQTIRNDFQYLTKNLLKLTTKVQY